MTVTRYGRRLAVLVLLVGAGFAVGDTPPPPTLALAVGGLTYGYLEPCGCGGQQAGGLGRRVSMLRAWRKDLPDLVYLDTGGLTDKPELLPLITRSLAVMGAAACGLASEDYGFYPQIRAAAQQASLQFTSTTPLWKEPPADTPAPPASLLVGPANGPQAAVLSVASGPTGLDDTFERAKAECLRIRSAGKALVTVLISHLGRLTTERLMQQIPEDSRPAIVVLATNSDFSQPVWERMGTLWVPVAWKGRSLSLITIRRSGRRMTIESDQQMVLEGPRDEVVQAWVNDYYSATKATERAGGLPLVSKIPPVTACEPCHASTVAAWRQHPHARAVETLEKAGRDVAACLPCHSEMFRREGIRPQTAGDRGIVCASCHRDLNLHLEDKRHLPIRLAPSYCRQCHSTENSPHYDEDAYLANVAGVCRGKAQERIRHAAGQSPPNAPAGGQARPAGGGPK